MALVLKDRVKETTTTAGTGTVTLGGAVTGFQSFAAIGDGNTTYYTIAAQSGSEWEVGIGTYTSSGTTLARTTVLSNSSGTEPSALSFSAGAKDVFVTYPSGKSVNLDASGNVTALGTPVSATLTNATGLPISSGVSGLGSNVATFLATPSSANLAAAVTDETGTGDLVFATSPTLVTPALGTPSALVGTNITGTASGLTAGNVTTNANLTGDVTSVGNATSIAAGVIVDADINASAAIVDTKLATISTAGKVSNSATTATDANTASAIVARDASGNFTAGTVTAALSGNATTATTLATGRTIAITGDLAYTSGSFNGSGNVTGTGTLATVNANVGSFTFSSITVNAKGLITAASSGSAPAEFVSGTAITFNQTAAPTGWTKSTAHDNKALRVVTGTVGSGGSVGFTTALATPTVTGSTSVSISGTTGATTLTTAQIPSHTHPLQLINNCGGIVGAQAAVGANFPGGTNTSAAGGGGSHTHSFSGSGSGSLTSGVATINVQYVDVIIATKN